MKARFALVAVLVVAAPACVSDTEPPTFVEWCSSVPVGDCAHMATEVAAGTIDTACVVRSPDIDEANLCFGQAVPETTVPDGRADPPPSGREFVEEAVEETLLAAHPDSVVTFGLAVAAPLALEEATGLATELGGSLVAVWRVDQVCVPAAGGFPGIEPTRFAWIDGVNRAAAERRAADEGTTVVTGRHIAESYWNRMEVAAAALDSEAQVVAVAVETRVDALPTLRANPALKLIRLSPVSVESTFEDTELPPATPLTCDS